MGNFEDQLWTELANAHGDELAGATRPPARRNRGRPLAMTAGAFGAVGIATTVSLALTATTSTPAYAVTRNHDGTVSVTIHDMIGITGANAELEKLGAPIRRATTPAISCTCPRCTRSLSKRPTETGRNSSRSRCDRRTFRPATRSCWPRSVDP